MTEITFSNHGKKGAALASPYQCEDFFQMSKIQGAPGWLFDIGDYTTQF